MRWRTKHDIDAVIPPPADGLTGYRDSVVQALRARSDVASERGPTAAQ